MFEGWGVEELRIGLTLYTDAFVVRGTHLTRQRRLSDILNEAEDGFLILTDATFERFGSVGQRRAAFAQVNLSAVLFGVADSTIEPSPELRTPKIQETALISVPPFEVTGRIHLMPERSLREALQELLGKFVPVTDATFWSDVAGESPRTAPMVAVNRGRAQILSPYDGAPADRPTPDAGS
ncbi:MAG TPA: hypothetical protein VLS28_04200 [Candidatus Sulfomarinibacteraceae bacterium]|nr:hypothetical protein [Candidatus Sulfomarinibacteraceae bacterium]